MSEQSTSRQNFIITAGAAVASVLSLGFFTKGTGSTSASVEKISTVSSSFATKPECRAVARTTQR